MHRIKLLLFDLDGTIADTSKDIVIAVNYALKKHGLRALSEKQIIKHVGEGARKLFTGLINENGNNTLSHVSDTVFIDKILITYLSYYKKHLVDNTKLYPSLKKILIHYHDKKKAVISNKSAELTKNIISKLHIEKYFDIISGADKNRKLKPNPETIIEVMRVLQSRPKETIMIGDGVNDILAAKSAGILSCAVGYGFGDKAQLLKYKPDFFINTLDELLKIIY